MDKNIPVPTVQVIDLKTAIDTKKKCVILDVRTHEEFTRGHVENSINLPVDEIAEKIVSVVPDKSTLIYVYCMSGSRSVVAAEHMKSIGYTNVFDVAHGILAWRISRYPMVV